MEYKQRKNKTMIYKTIHKIHTKHSSYLARRFVTHY